MMNRARRKLSIVVKLSLTSALCFAGEQVAFCQEIDSAETNVASSSEVDLELLTKDRVILRGTYLKGTKGKESIPIILLHGWDGPRGPGSGRDMAALAARMQKAGHAVIIPDLRGHGRSTQVKVDGDTTRTLDRNRFGPTDFRDMALDVEAIRSFLVERHNAGELNLELLCVMGADMGSVVALNWIHYDWMAPSVPALKQGQDVKAFVLISPTRAFKGAAVKPALANQTIRRDLAALLVYGKTAAGAPNARRIYKTFEKARARRNANDELPQLFHLELDTRLTGTKLLSSPQLHVDDAILKFVEECVAPLRETHPWTTRRRL